MFRLRAGYFPAKESNRRRVKVHSARNTLQAGYSLLHSLAPPSPTLTRFAGLSAGPQCRGCGPGPRGSHPEGKSGRDLTGAGADLWLCLLSPPAAALRWVRLDCYFPCLEARLAGQQSRGAAVNSLPLGEGGSASAETDEGNAKGFCLSYVETAHLSIAFPSSAPSGHLPPGEGWGYRLSSPRGKSKKGDAVPSGPFRWCAGCRGTLRTASLPLLSLRDISP